MSDTRPDTFRIEQEIRQTRAELDDTLDALKDKLTPGGIVDQVLPQIQKRGMDMGRNFVRTNQVPLALVATGLAWLMLRNGAHQSEDQQNGRSPGDGHGLDEADYDALEHHDFVHDTLSGITQKAGETLEAFNERLYDAKAGALGLKRDAAEELNLFRQRIDHRLSQLAAASSSARRKVIRQGARLRAGAKNFVHAAEVRGERIAAQGRDYYEEHPLIVGAFGIAAGAALGAVLPHSAVEDRVLGDAGEKLRHRASGAVHAARDAARDAGRHFAEAAREAARREGLTMDQAKATADDVLQRAKRVGEDVVQAGRDEIESRRPGG